MTKNALLRVADLQEAIGLSRSTVYRLVDSGELPAPFKIGGSTFWRAATVERFLADREAAALADAQ